MSVDWEEENEKGKVSISSDSKLDRIASSEGREGPDSAEAILEDLLRCGAFYLSAIDFSPDAPVYSGEDFEERIEAWLERRTAFRSGLSALPADAWATFLEEPLAGRIVAIGTHRTRSNTARSAEISVDLGAKTVSFVTEYDPEKHRLGREVFVSVLFEDPVRAGAMTREEAEEIRKLSGNADVPPGVAGVLKRISDRALRRRVSKKGEG